MRIDILGVGFDNLTMTEAVARGCELLAGEGAHYVVTPNPEIVETCRADAEAMAAGNGADRRHRRHLRREAPRHAAQVPCAGH